MVRTYVKKTQRILISETDMRRAIKDVIKKKKSIRAAAFHHDIKPATLQHRIEKLKKLNKVIAIENSDSDSAFDEETQQQTFQSKYSSRQVFSREEEKNLEKYLLKSSQIQFGLTYHQARSLAYQYACRLQKSLMPSSWHKNKMAGIFWMQSFMKRHPDLSLRRPENTSLGRATAFNRHNIDEFFNNFCVVMEKYKFTSDRILNVDETGVTTVMDAPKVIAAKGTM